MISVAQAIHFTEAARLQAPVLLKLKKKVLPPRRVSKLILTTMCPKGLPSSMILPPSVSLFTRVEC